MEMTERPHRGTTSDATGELFICFTSRLSSSMKLSSKSILSPARDSSQISLSRRLRPSGSLRAGQASPMFPPATSKKRGCAFDNPEPSSPKVTCIGQVRVKTKGKKIGPRSKRRGEVSFRKSDPNNAAAAVRNDHEMGHLQQSQQECRKWVHLPVTICEALRAIGTEFNCFLPCRSSCMASHREKEEKASADGGSGGNGGGSSCGTVLARWLVAAVQEGEEGKGREIELVVGEEEEEEIVRSSYRRHVFEDIEINFCDNENDKEGRVSICIPPKNALLLMRCRSDPVKMATLANRSWEPALGKNEEYVDEEDEKEDEVKAAPLDEQEEEPEIEQHESSEFCEELIPFEAAEEEEVTVLTEVEPEFISYRGEAEETVAVLEVTSPDSEVDGNGSGDQRETAHESLAEVPEDLETAQEMDTNVSCSEQEKERDHSEQTPDPEAEPEPEPEESASNVESVDENFEKISSEQEFVETGNEQEASPVSENQKKTEDSATEQKDAAAPRTEETEKPDPEENGSKQEDSKEKLLPDCLLMMMCEPKLSMEVSKETWVCSTDFIRWKPEKQQQKAVKVQRKDGTVKDESKGRISVDCNPVQQLLLQPARSSCSFPAAPPVATAAVAGAIGKGASGGGSIAREQKHVRGKGCEPFVLTRCKSEPMRSSSKLAPESCFWKNRKLELATLGVGAAGGGF